MIAVVTSLSTYSFSFENIRVGIPRQFLTDLLVCIVLTGFDSELFGYDDGGIVREDLGIFRSQILHKFYECESELDSVNGTYVTYPNNNVTYIAKTHKNNKIISIEEFKARSQTEAVFNAVKYYHSHDVPEDLHLSVYILDKDSNLSLRCIFSTDTKNH